MTTPGEEINFSDIGYLDKSIGELLECKPLPEDQIKALAEKAKEILVNESSPIRASSWFTKYQKKEALPFLGDVMFYALLRPLTQGDTPLLKLENQQHPWSEHLVSITAHGQACLINEFAYIQDYWVGGIHCQKAATQWQWDHKDIKTLSV